MDPLDPRSDAGLQTRIRCSRCEGAEAGSVRSRAVLIVRYLSLLSLLLPGPPEEFILRVFAQEPGRPYTISLDVDLVLLDVAVLDRSGGFVSGLSKDNFQVYENGRLQEIEHFHQSDVPVTIGLVIDNSGSMMPKRSEVLSAAQAFIRASNPRDEMFAVLFNENAALALNPGLSFTNDPEVLQTALSSDSPVGKTALYDAIALALEHLKKGRFYKRALLVISDGADNASTHKFEEILRMVQESRSTLYSIALFDPDEPDHKPKILERLSRVSGAEFFSPGTLRDLEKICRKIARDIRNHYVLGYFSTNASHDGSYRPIRVSASSPGRGKFSVRTREGYYAPGPGNSFDAERESRREP